MTVDGSIVERTTAYIYSRNMSGAAGSWTAPKSSHTGTSSHPFTLYLSDYPVMPPSYPVMPPSDTDITTAVGKVKVDCQTNDSHETKEYDLIPNSYSVNVSKDVAEITIQPEKYVTEYNKYSNGHTLDPIGQTQTVTLKYTDNGWKKTSTGDVVFTVKCADPTPPTPSGDPASDDLKKALEEKIKVECNRVTGHNAIYGLLNGSYDVGTRSGNTYTFTVKAEKYVVVFNQTYSNHALVSPESQQITLTYDNGEWKYNGAVAAIFTVHCEEPAPQNPTDNDVLGLGMKVKLDCETYPSGDHDQEYPLEAGTFTISNVSGDAAGGYTCTIIVRGEGYLAKLNEAFPAFTHTWASDVTEKSITLKYDQTGAKWTLQDGNDNPVTFAVQCEGVTPPTGDTPDGPDGDVVKALLKVSLQCTVKSDHKKDYSQLLSASYEIGNVQSDGNNGYICQVSIFANPYIAAYSAESSVPHTLGGEPTQTVTLKYNKELGNWAVDGGSGIVTFLMKCSEEPIGPGEPTDEEIKNLGECVEIICQNAAAGHEAQYAALEKGTFEVKMDVSADIPTATITLNNPKPYALIYDMNLQSGATHAVTSFSGSVTLRYRGGRWGLVEDDMGSWPPFRVNLTCAAAPTDQPTPTPAPAANVPKTGDNSQLGLWLALLLGSGMAVLLLAQNRRRKNAK